MTIIKDSPYTKKELGKLKELFEVYIKTVIDIEKGICCAGCDRHSDCEQLLLKKGSKQENLWGGGVDLAIKITDCNSIINLKPKQGNRSNEIQDSKLFKKFEDLARNFFKEVL